MLSGCPGLSTSLCNSSKVRRVSAVVSSATAVHPSQWYRRRSLRQSTQRRPQSAIGPAPLRVSASASTTHSSSSSSRGIPASRSPKQQRASVFIPPRSIRFSNGSKHAVRSASADASCTRQLAPRALDGSSSGVRPATPGNAAQSGDANPSDARSTVDGHARVPLGAAFPIAVLSQARPGAPNLSSRMIPATRAWCDDRYDVSDQQRCEPRWSCSAGPSRPRA